MLIIIINNVLSPQDNSAFNEMHFFNVERYSADKRDPTQEPMCSWGKYLPRMIGLCDWPFETNAVVVYDSSFLLPRTKVC